MPYKFRTIKTHLDSWLYVLKQPRKFQFLNMFEMKEYHKIKLLELISIIHQTDGLLSKLKAWFKKLACKCEFELSTAYLEYDLCSKDMIYLEYAFSYG